MNKLKTSCVIVGAGTYGQVYLEYLKEDYDIVGFIDDDAAIHGTEVNGILVLGDSQFLVENIDKSTKVFVPVGNTIARQHLLRKVRGHGFSTPNFVHPSVNIHPSATIGDQGVYLLQGVIIMPLTVISDDVMISAGTIISHHTSVLSNVFISFGVNIGACVIIAKKSYIGIGATIMTGVKYVGEDTVVGAGSVIIRDVPDGVTIVGNPGKIIKTKDI